MNRILNWGTVGCGGIANKFAASSRKVDGVKIVAAASRTSGKAKAFASEQGIKKVYTEYASLLKDEEVEAVYVATTHNFHFENVKEILNAGKHVLCEKPMCVNAAEIIGTRGRITIPEKFLGAEEVWLDKGDAPTIQKRFDIDDKTSFSFEIAAATESIKQGKLENEIMPLSDTLQLMETIDEIKAQLGLVYENDR